MNVEIVAELEKPFSRFAERAIAPHNDDRLNTRSQRLARFDRRVAGSFCFVGLILNAGGVELFLNGGPQAPHSGGAVVDDDPYLDPCYPWLGFTHEPERDWPLEQVHARVASHRPRARSAGRCH